MDRFDAMRAFARVVEAGSFTKAAETLQISRARLTQMVQQLEARLQVQLLNRTTRKLNVTVDGAVYYERVIRLLADLDEAETTLPGSSLLPAGRLRIDVPSTFARMILVPALPAFHARYPDIRFDMGVSDRMVDLIGENVDCVVRGGTPTESSLRARHVGDLSLRVYASRDYLTRAGTPTDPRALNQAPHHIVGFLSARTGQTYPITLRRDNEQVTVRGHHILSVDDGDAYLAAALAGLGALWLPEYLAAPHVQNGTLVPLFADWHIEPMPLYVLFPPNRHVSAALRVFVDWMVELIPQHAPFAARHRGALTNSADAHTIN